LRLFVNETVSPFFKIIGQSNIIQEFYKSLINSSILPRYIRRKDETSVTLNITSRCRKVAAITKLRRSK